MKNDWYRGRFYFLLSSQCSKTRKRLKGIQTERKERKLASFTDDKTIYVENSKDSTKRLLGLRSQFRMVARYMINVQSQLYLSLHSLNNWKEIFSQILLSPSVPSIWRHGSNRLHKSRRVSGGPRVRSPCAFNFTCSFQGKFPWKS